MSYTRTWRDRVAMGLMVVAALGAIVAFLGSLGQVFAASPDTQIVEAWRLFGFVVFAGIFSLLAWRPRHYPGVWELAILHKGAMAVTGVVLLSANARDAADVALIDGILAILLIIAYILARGHTAWKR